MNVKSLLKDKNIRQYDHENLVQVKWNSIKNWAKRSEWSKEKETLDDVKPVENIHKNHQSFQRMSNVKKEAPLSHKLQDHTHE